MATASELKITLLASDTDEPVDSDIGEGLVSFERNPFRSKSEGTKGNGASVIENVPLISRTLSSPATSHALANEFDDEEFARLVREAEYAIDHGVSPQLISQGSSGSYFVRNIHEVRTNVRGCMLLGFGFLKYVGI
jgi:hypothetical protein